MSLRFVHPTNPWIDRLVYLAQEQQGDHAREPLFVPLREEDKDLIDDSLGEDEQVPTITDFSLTSAAAAFASTPTPPASPCVVAVDAGVVDLGELATGGTVFAVRGTAICYPPNGGRPCICRYNTGAIAIDRNNMFPLFHYMGNRLGMDNLYVNVSSSPPYYTPKSAMGETANQIQDRCRNFVERMIQEEAVAILAAYGGGILLIDGALAAGTYDTPDTYLDRLLSNCRRHSINVAAISKKTRITIASRPISSLFAEYPDFVGYASIRAAIDEERQSVVQATGRLLSAVSAADDIFAVRFSYTPPGLTFRVDVHPRLGYLSAEVLDQVFNQCQIYGGYPRPLIEAHQYSAFLYQDVRLLLADVVARLGVHPEEKPSMEVLFQPFGGSRK
jgi:hypothetical protein